MVSYLLYLSLLLLSVCHAKDKAVIAQEKLDELLARSASDPLITIAGSDFDVCSYISTSY